jgi:hypothetical protein
VRPDPAGAPSRCAERCIRVSRKSDVGFYARVVGFYAVFGLCARVGFYAVGLCARVGFYTVFGFCARVAPLFCVQLKLVFHVFFVFRAPPAPRAQEARCAQR